MLVSSILNPSARSSVQLLVVHFNDERVLVPAELHAKYSDLQGFIVKEWGFESPDVFYVETDELDICAGKRVRIHEEAWFGVKDVVGNVYVRIRRSKRDDLKGPRYNQISKRDDLKGQRYNQMSLSVKDEVKHEDALTSQAASESADEAEVEQQTRTEIPKNEITEETPTIRMPSESADEAEVEQQTRTEFPKSEITEETPTIRRREQESKQDKKDQPESPKKQKPQGDTLNLFNDEVDADVPGASGTRADGDEQKEESSPDTLNLFNDEVDADVPGASGARADKDEQKEESSPGTENTPAPRPTWKSLLGSLHRSTSNGSSNNSANAPHTASTIGTPAFNTPVPVSKTRSKAESSATAATDGAAAAMGGSGGDLERVLIVVEPPPDSIYEARGFRIRREHSVRTVLKGACKAFKIDYTKTRLRMVTEVDENSQGDGELITVKCNDADTMNSLDIEDNQRFVIEMVDEDEDGDGESEA
ncbi:hypothetical protein A7U60_g7188 [Sanghuangporus baumii]|uniref:Uncharacterized protein n=1 Tax=Sanghuangporus baumii TaxID=108892 RepID=A0A9Q5HTX1_SANBA|nr:hypothetical protein A7U60_g7188 [Sanghuangporus baumii]